MRRPTGKAAWKDGSRREATTAVCSGSRDELGRLKDAPSKAEIRQPAGVEGQQKQKIDCRLRWWFLEAAEMHQFNLKAR